MFTLNKFLILVLVGSCISSLQADENLKAVPVNPQQLVEVTQLKVEQNKLGDATYTYKCTVGTGKTGHVGCNGRDRTSWATPHDVALTLRCPPNGTGPIIAYVEIIYTVTTQSVNCRVINGGVGANYIKMEVDAFGTQLMDYSCNFYVL